MIELDWLDLRTRCSEPDAPKDAVVFGVPRGGIHVAHLLCELRGCSMADDPWQADYLVDDVYDSGRTHERWSGQHPQKLWWWAYDKRLARWSGQWLQFPWERHEDTRPAEHSAARLLQALGIDLDTEGTRETPERMVKALREMTEGYSQDPVRILSKQFAEDYDEMIVVRDMPFYSLCEHHVLPFYGTATVGYISSGRLLGLSKAGRLVRCFSRRLQVQERMTHQIATALQTELASAGVGCVVRATHMCMAMRGAECRANMVTECLLGALRTDGPARTEFLALARANADG